MFSIISSHKKIIIGIVVVVLLFLAYGAFMPKKDTSSTALKRQNTSTSSYSSTDPKSPGRQFVTQLLAIQNIHYNLELFDDPAFEYLKDWSKDLTPQAVGRDNPFAPLESGLGTGAAESSTGFVKTSESASSTPSRTATTTTKTTPQTVPATPRR